MASIGIDLGTTNSLAARVNARGIPAVYPDRNDASLFQTPSVVHIDGSLALVGKAAEDLQEEKPALRVARHFKLQLGNGDVRPVNVADWSTWGAVAYSSLVLKKLRMDAEAFDAEPVEGAVVTVPANFSDPQRKATLAAADLAGLKVLRLVEEPVAAAVFYAAQTKSADTTSLVFDFGGGTFDASVVRTAASGVSVLATEGCVSVGGRNLDDAIIALIGNQVTRVGGPDLRTDAAAWSQARRYAETAKIKLSNPSLTQVRQTILIGGRTLDFLLSRREIDAVVDPYMDQVLAACKRCLVSAGLKWSDLDRLLLTGGTCLVPRVLERLQQECNKPTSAIVRQQPHQAIAFGAAILAQQATAPQSPETGGIVQQIAPYELGLRVWDSKTKSVCVQPLISRNTPLPATSCRTFYTSRADQARMVFDLVQRRELTELVSLGFFEFGPIVASQKNYPVELVVEYDRAGVLHVRCRDPRNGNEVRRTYGENGQRDAGVQSLRKCIEGARINE